MTRSFGRFALRGLITSLALGPLAAVGTATAAFGAQTGNPGGNAAATPSSARPDSAPGRSGVPSAVGNSPRTGTAGGASGHGTGNGAGTTGRPNGPSSSSGSSGSASGNSANGNKGHIQIEGAADCGTTLCGEDNDPHVEGCTLTVELFGYPSGSNSAVLTISGQAPSGTATVLSDSFVFTVPTTAPPNGSFLDTSRTYTPTDTQLAGLTPQANQGYHLRVDVAVNGFHTKTHVIWLDCVPALSGSTGGLTGGRGPLGPAPYAPDTTWGSAKDAPDNPLSVMTAAGADAPRSSGLAFTGLDVIGAIAAATLLLLLGIGLVVLSRRAKRVNA